MSIRWLGVATCACFVAGPAAGAVIYVDTLVDEYNSGGSCSLREAVEAANTNSAGRGCSAGSGVDAILFDPALNGAIHLVSGQIDIAGPLEIAAEPSFRIGVRAAPSSRIFYLSTPTADVTLRGLVLFGGRAGGSGGAISTGPSGGTQVNLIECVLRDNQSGAGGAISLNQSAGTALPILSVVDSTFIGNASVSGGATDGAGGAISVYSSATPDASEGNDVSVEIVRSNFIENVSFRHGGAIRLSEQYARIDRSAFVGNFGGDFAGALDAVTSTVEIVNSTFLWNSGDEVGAIGMRTLDSLDRVRMAFVTVVENESRAGSGGGFGFGAFGAGTPDVEVSASLVAGNVGSADCALAAPYGWGFASGGYNVFGSVAGCTLPAVSDATGAQPNIEAVGMVSPGSLVVLPSTSSLAVEKIPAASCLGLEGQALTVDQRGGTRPLRYYLPLPGSPAARCDSGAMERTPVEFLPWVFKDGFETGNTLLWWATAP